MEDNRSEVFQKYQNDLQEEENEGETNMQVLRREIHWDRMCQAKIISEHQAELIRSFDKKPAEEREALLNDAGEDYARLFLDFISYIATQADLQYVLAIVDEILQDKSRVGLFLALSSPTAPTLPFTPFINLLNRAAGGDPFIKSRASRIVALLLGESTDPPEHEVKFLSQWCEQQLRSQEPRDVVIAVTALQRFLRKDAHRLIFHQSGGLELLGNLLIKPDTKRQLLYQTLYCLWLLSYNKKIAKAFGEVFDLVKNIVEVIRLQDKEKIRRLSLATLRNISEEANNNEQMISAGMMKVLNYLSQKKWGDPDIEEDIKHLLDVLDENMVVLSSFDTYKAEVLSGELTWSPVHRLERFWRENIGRFEEDNFRILTVLLDIIRSSQNPKVLAIACHDLGEFVRFHPRGRRVLATLEGKVDIMKLMAHPDEEVQKHALLCVQKMMVHNWEYLARANIQGQVPAKRVLDNH